MPHVLCKFVLETFVVSEISSRHISLSMIKDILNDISECLNMK